MAIAKSSGAPVRWMLRAGGNPEEAREALEAPESSDRHGFWPDALAFREIAVHGVVGHRQVTDAYLAGLARTAGAGSSRWTAGWPSSTRTRRSA